MKSYDVFVSYSRKDIEKVLPIVEEIKTKGVSVWMDLTGIHSGEAFVEKIAAAIDSSDSVLFMYTDNAISGMWTRKEIMYARDQSKTVIPILLDGIMPSRGWFKFLYSDIDCIDITNAYQKKKFHDNLVQWYVSAKGEILNEVNYKKARYTESAEINISDEINKFAEGHVSLRQCHDQLEEGRKAIRSVQTCDDNGNIVRITHLGEDGLPAPCEGGYSEEIRSYDESNHCVLIEYFDTKGRLCCCSEEYAVVEMKYSRAGNCLQRTFYDTGRKPCLCKQGYASVSMSYYNKQCINIKFCDTTQTPCCNISGCALVKLIYNVQDELIKTEEYDLDGKLLRSQEYMVAKSRSVKSQVAKPLPTKSRVTKMSQVEKQQVVNVNTLIASDWAISAGLLAAGAIFSPILAPVLAGGYLIHEIVKGDEDNKKK